MTYLNGGALLALPAAVALFQVNIKAEKVWLIAAAACFVLAVIAVCLAQAFAFFTMARRAEAEWHFEQEQRTLIGSVHYPQVVEPEKARKDAQRSGTPRLKSSAKETRSACSVSRAIGFPSCFSWPVATSGLKLSSSRPRRLSRKRNPIRRPVLLPRAPILSRVQAGGRSREAPKARARLLRSLDANRPVGLVLAVPIGAEAKVCFYMRLNKHCANGRRKKQKYERNRQKLTSAGR